jgi:hypothetical protein
MDYVIVLEELLACLVGLLILLVVIACVCASMLSSEVSQQEERGLWLKGKAGHER